MKTAKTAPPTEPLRWGDGRQRGTVPAPSSPFDGTNLHDYLDEILADVTEDAIRYHIEKVARCGTDEEMRRLREANQPYTALPDKMRSDL